MTMQAFSDRKTAVQDIIAEGDQVAVRVRMTGTNSGGMPWLNIPANGRPVDIEWISIYRLRDGKVVEHRAMMDLRASCSSWARFLLCPSNKRGHFRAGVPPHIVLRAV